jgi:hypothetical protein
VLQNIPTHNPPRGGGGVAAVAVVVVVMRAEKKAVEVVVTITAIIVAIRIRRSTRTLLMISVTVFLVTSVAISPVMLMTTRLMRTCAVSSMTLNTAPGPQTVYCSSLISRLAKEFQA